MAKKQSGKSVVKGKEEEEQNELLVEIFGVTMLLPKEKKVVMPNGVKARLSMDKLMAIAPHIAFIAFEQSKYEPSPKMHPALSFFYDIDGDGKKEILFDAFLFDKDTVRFEDVARRQTEFSIDDIPTVADLSQDIEICPAVISGNSTKVIATINLSNAKSIKGEDQGDDKLPVAFGTVTRNWAEKIVAEFERNGGEPRVVLTNETQSVEFKLKKNATRVMIGNVPAQEVMKLNDLDDYMRDHPLSHIELLYDLFHLPCGCEIPATPTGKMPALTHPMPLGANRCGPPIQA
jgi:hypothetical protein